MIKPMAKEHIHMLMVHTIKAIGLMINNMELEWNHGQMVLNMKESIEMAKKMAGESLPLLIQVIMKENSVRMRFVDMASIIGLMESTMRELGKRIKCMAKEFLFGKMARGMKGISSMIREKALEISHGLMGGCM